MSLQSDKQSKSKLIDELGVILSSSMALALVTQGCHWNVTGPNFYSLHEMFGRQYAELLEASDELAERMRALRAEAPSGLLAFAKRSIVEQATEAAPDTRARLLHLQKSHEALSERCAALRRLADEADDAATGDLMNGRTAAHDKAAWMLRSHLEG